MRGYYNNPYLNGYYQHYANRSYNPFIPNQQYPNYPQYPYPSYYQGQCNCPECNQSCNCPDCSRYRNYHQRQEEEKKETPQHDPKKTENTQNKKSQYELSLEYENQIRQEIERTTPLVSGQKDIKVLIEDYKGNEEYSSSVKTVTEKYKFIRKVRRDGNCFYRSFIYRLFENICMKNNKDLYDKILKKITDSKDLTQRNGYEWLVVEDFYNLFYEEFTTSFNSLEKQNLTVRDYLDCLFENQEKGTYLIYFVRFCIAAYLKENFADYEMFVDGPFDKWVQQEVEAIDHEADQIQIKACVEYFGVGVKIEMLNPNQNEVVKFPDNIKDEDIFINVLFTPGHYDILYP